MYYSLFLNNSDLDMLLLFMYELGETKIRHLGIVILIEEDVLRLDITMDDLLSAVVVQIRQSPGRTQGNPVPGLPV